MNKVCEHCQIDIYVNDWYYGKCRLYSCVKGIRKEGHLGLCNEPCKGYFDCFKRGLSPYPTNERKSKFKYKWIPSSKMKKSKACIEQEKEDREKRLKEAQKLEREGVELLLKAKKLRENKE